MSQLVPYLIVLCKWLRNIRSLLANREIVVRRICLRTCTIEHKKYVQRTARQPRNEGFIPDNWGSTSDHLCQLNTIIMAVHLSSLGLIFLSPWKAGFGNILDNNVHIQPKWRWTMLTWPGIFITIEGCFSNSFGNNVYKQLIRRNTRTQASPTSLSLWQSFPTTAYLQTLRMPCVGGK